jgi:hypothetical protein
VCFKWPTEFFLQIEMFAVYKMVPVLQLYYTYAMPVIIYFRLLENPNSQFYRMAEESGILQVKCHTVKTKSQFSVLPDGGRVRSPSGKIRLHRLYDE